MWVLTRIGDRVKVIPSKFDVDLPTALRDAINERYANKVIHDVGLCVCVYQINSIGDANIFPGDASAYYKVVFQVVVFRPFKNEVLRGKIKSSSETGVTVSVGFFDDIVIPSSLLRHPSVFNKEEQVWVWKYGDHELFMDVGHPIAVRVDRLVFSKTYAAPDTGDGISMAADDHDQVDPDDDIEAIIHEARKRTPMLAIATIDKDGLGCLEWWDDGEDEEAEEAEEESNGAGVEVADSDDEMGE